MRSSVNRNLLPFRHGEDVKSFSTGVGCNILIREGARIIAEMSDIDALLDVAEMGRQM